MRPRRLQVGEVGDRLQRGLELLVGEHDPERRLRFDHRRPGRHRVDVAEQRRRLGAEDVHQRRVELGAAALPSDRDRRVHASAAVVDLDDVCEVHQPRGHEDLAALGLRRHPLAVPALERLVQAFAHLLRRVPSRRRQLVGRQPVILDHLAGGAPPVADELHAQASALRQSPAGADVASRRTPSRASRSCPRGGRRP